MLIKEIGRFGDGIYNIKPTDLADKIPEELKNSYIGFFWHIGGNRWIIRKANVLDNSLCAVEMGQNYDDIKKPDDLQIEYALFHKDVWEAEIRTHSDYKDFDFDYFSRGRVVYEFLDKKYTIFVPNGFQHNKGVISFLVKTFNLPYNGYRVNSSIYKKKKDFQSLSGEKNYLLEI